MSDLSNYKQTDVIGKTWTRCNEVVISNPYNEKPHAVFKEEEIFPVDGGVLKKDIFPHLLVIFDPNNPEDMALYDGLNAKYVEARTKRDEAVLAMQKLVGGIK